MEIFDVVGDLPKNRALYFHIPFCQDICAFCPFSREVCKDEETLDLYTDALIKEIYLKSKYKNIKKFPINAIFFGGGTPSILKPRHILKIGKAIHENFDLSQLKEFSYEMNAKTVTPDRVEALKSIGVTHARMGVQTFNPKYRELFKLSATLEQIYYGAKLLNDNFKYVCIDMLYGMHGQTIDEFIRDLNCAIKLNTPTIDIYPINNLVTQTRLSTEYKNHNLNATSGLTKFLMNVILRESMKNNGYLPHNGHGYIKSSKNIFNNHNVVTDEYRFQYHEAVYGYKGHEVIGFGSAACSIFDGFLISNSSNTKKYINDLLNSNCYDFDIYQYDKKVCENKGICLHLPYHGEVEKSKINYELVDPEVLSRLRLAINHGLIIEKEDKFELTQLGWYWYVNLLYYLSPTSDQKKLEDYINGRCLEKNRFVEEWNIDLGFN
ncbi:radical SAM protein [Clostridium sp. KNHs214]|uniref:radical SAM protein n=1 Tax=Clostridium sp. KNHs214 TaxID=1540257 RepID=UPI000B2AADE6|nr:radical SAM protein [Clostridium sp. KNHs214]